MSKMCNISLKKQTRNPLEVSSVQTHLWNHSNALLYMQSCPSSGDTFGKEEAGEKDRGRERYNRSSSTVIGVLLQREKKRKVQLS